MAALIKDGTKCYNDLVSLIIGNLAKGTALAMVGLKAALPL